MDFDPNTILFGGASFFLVLLFLVQTVREFFQVAPQKVPMVALLMGVGILVLAVFLPDDIEQAIAYGTLAAASVSFAVRYVKNGQVDEPTTERRDRVQGNHPQVEGSSGEGQQSQSIVNTAGHTGVQYRTDTERLPYFEQDNRSRNRSSG